MTGDRAEAHCTETIRKDDRDHWLTGLLAPDGARARLHVLYAFNQEIARIREAITEPMMGQIRLQWWRESVEGAAAGTPREHPVAQALVPMLAEGWLSVDELIALVDAREADLDPDNFPTMDALTAYCGATGGALERLAVRLLGADAHGPGGEAAFHVGRARALTGQLRSAAWRAAQLGVDLPRDRLAAHGVDPGDMMAGRPGEGLSAVAHEIAEAARSDIRAARALRGSVPKQSLPVLMLARLAETSLKRIARNDYALFTGRTEPVPIAALVNLYAGALTNRY